MTVDGVLSYQFNLDSENQVLTVTRNGNPENLNGIYTDDGTTKKLLIDENTFIEVTSDTVVVLADGIYRKFSVK